MTADLLVGRTKELGRLLSAAGIDGVGGPGAVLLSGDAGIGKTRLLRELTDRALAGGHRVLTGHCLDLGENAFPFQPFVEIFAALSEDERNEVVDRIPAVAPLLPGGRRSEPGSGSGELFAAVASALGRLASDRPVLVLLEDVHWADASTRHLIGYLLAQPLHIHVVVSYRSDDLYRRHPLRTAVAEWARLGGVRRLDLGPLDDADVRALVRSRGGEDVGAEAMATIVRRAEGNAFLVEELVDADTEDGSSLPETLADLLLVRLDRLGDPARQVVRAASCAGFRVTDTLLAEVVDIDPDDLDAALRSALDHKILTRGPDNSYAFRHALLAEVVYDDLLPGERRRFHRAYLAALTRDGVDVRAAEIANHAFEAGDLPRAFAARVAAGDQAVRVHGHDVAAGFYERALEIADAAPDGTDLVDLVVRAGEALTAAGHLQRAVALVEDNLNELAPDASISDRGRLLVEFGTAALNTSAMSRAEAAASDALAIIPEEPTVLRALAENLYANVALESRRDDEAALWAGQAKALAQRLGLSHVVADATAIQEGLNTRTGNDPDEAKRRLTALIATTRSEGNVVGELRAQNHLAFLHHDLGELDAAQEAFLAAMNRAATAGRSWAPYGFDGRVFASVIAYLRGRWDLVTELSRVGKQTPPPLAAATLEAVGLLVSAGRGERAALRTAERIRPMWNQDFVLAVHAGTAAIDLAPDADSAVAWHDDLVGSLSDDWDSEFAPVRMRMAGLVLGRLASAAPLADASRRAADARVVARVVREAERVRARHGPFGPEGQAWSSRIAAEAARFGWLAGDGDTGLAPLVDLWRENVAGFDALGQVFEAARSRTRLAAILQASGDTAAAQQLLAPALEAATGLGAAPLLAELDAIGPMSVPHSRHAFDELTPRELEVLVQVAAGRTNGEIAKLLFISPKTVSVHVSNFLTKLGATTRTEAAAIARRRGLLGD